MVKRMGSLRTRDREGVARRHAAPDEALLAVDLRELVEEEHVGVVREIREKVGIVGEAKGRVEVGHVRGASA
jgi:hypothetical protein